MEIWEKGCILNTYRGSITYGTNLTARDVKGTILDKSDVDTHGICIVPIEYLLSWDAVWGDKRFEQYEEGEYICYSLFKWLKLALKCNPNILEMLWVPKNYIIYMHPVGQKLWDNRTAFLSKEAKSTFSGYAYSQMMKTEKKKNKGYDYLKNKEDHELTSRERSRLEFGYDTKFMLHTFRLLDMGIEILTEGRVNVFRDNNEFLKDIRFGYFSFEDLKKRAQRKFELLDEAYVRSDLPDKVNRAEVKELCKELHEEFWSQDS